VINGDCVESGGEAKKEEEGVGVWFQCSGMREEGII